MDIKITIKRKLPICGDVAIVCNNSDYTVIWELDEEWSGYDTKTMRTVYKDGTYTDTVFTGNTVALPVVTVPGTVKIGLYAGDIRTSRPALIRALPSITSDGGAPADPPEDVYNQIMELIKKMETVSPEDIAKAVEDYLTEHPAAAASMRVEGGYIQFSADGKTWEDVIALADLKGAPGKDGAPGDDGITPHIGDNGNWYLGDEDTGKPSHGEKGDTGDTGPQGPAGAGMNVTGATVGQIAKISAVDDNGKPTAWETIDGYTGQVTAEKLTNPDHATDLVQYAAFQAAVPMVQQMNIVGATVGQIIKIEAVDSSGRPTQWEAVDMPSGGGGELQWIKVASVVTEEETNVLSIGTDSEGREISGYHPLAMIVCMTIPADSTQNSNSGEIWMYPSKRQLNAAFRIIQTIVNWKTTLRSVSVLYCGRYDSFTSNYSMTGNIVDMTEDSNVLSGVYLHVRTQGDHFPIGTKVNVAVLSKGWSE